MYQFINFRLNINQLYFLNTLSMSSPSKFQSGKITNKSSFEALYSNKPNLEQKQSNSEANYSTNNTMIYYQGSERPTMYLATYVRAKVISISNISYKQMSAKLNCQIFIDISYRSISQRDKSLILEQGIKITFQKDQMLALSRDNSDVYIYDNQAEKRIEFVVRKFIKTGIICQDLMWSPFQVIQCEIIFKLNKVRIKIPFEQYKVNQDSLMSTFRSRKLEQKSIQANNPQFITKQFHFNMMNHPKTQVKLKYPIDSDFGLFQIASLKLQADYFCSFKEVSERKAQKKQRIEQQKKKGSLLRRFRKEKVNIQKLDDEIQLARIKRGYGQQSLTSFKVAMFTVPLFKKPTVASITIFIPLLVLSITSLSIFFCQPDLFKRIASIAALMVAFVALVPTIRQQIPPTSTITLVEILVFSQALTAILALIHSLRIRQQPQDWQLDYKSEPEFLTSLIITVIVNTIVFGMVVLYNLKWVPSYVRKTEVQEEFKQDEKLNIYEWKNDKCDLYFRKYIESNTLRILSDKQQFQNAILQKAKQIGERNYKNQTESKFDESLLAQEQSSLQKINNKKGKK